LLGNKNLVQALNKVTIFFSPVLQTVYINELPLGVLNSKKYFCKNALYKRTVNMAENYLVFANGTYYQDFLIEQEIKRLEFLCYNDSAGYGAFLEEQRLNRLEFAYTTRMAFIDGVRNYFRHSHAIPLSLLHQRRDEVSLIKFFV
jgi:hypothetical protein